MRSCYVCMVREHLLLLLLGADCGKILQLARPAQLVVEHPATYKVCHCYGKGYTPVIEQWVYCLSKSYVQCILGYPNTFFFLVNLGTVQISEIQPKINSKHHIIL